MTTGRKAEDRQEPVQTETEKLAPALSHDAARNFYDRFGRKQDRQAFYEDRAIAVLEAHARFEEAGHVLELGCGTGRLAERLLRQRLSAECRYLGIDLSPTMVDIAARRLRPWGGRAEVRLSDGAPVFDAPDRSVDRFLATYVLDLLAPDDIRAALDEAHRVLVPQGLLCLAGLTHGERGVPRLVSFLWRKAYARWPTRLGGCRPLRAVDFLDTRRWDMLHREVVSNWGIPSEVIVAAAMDQYR